MSSIYKLSTPETIQKFNELKEDMKNLEDESYINICKFYDKWHKDFDNTIDGYNSEVESRTLFEDKEFEVCNKDTLEKEFKSAIEKVELAIKIFDDMDVQKPVDFNMDFESENLGEAKRYMLQSDMKPYRYDKETREYVTVKRPPKPDSYHKFIEKNI